MQQARWIVQASLAALSALVAVGQLAAPASAASGVPQVGECYLITDKQTFDDYWPGASPVPCSQRHSLQVTASSVLPADVNAVTFAQDHCGYADVWKSLGINQARRGIVYRPIRMEAFYFVVQQPGAPVSYICGAGPVVFRGKKDSALVTMTSAVADLTARQKAALQYCNAAANGRTIQDPPVSVSCARTPRWQVEKWILWDAFYKTYPGEEVLRARAQQICGPGTTPSVPSADVWPGGTHRSWCYKKHT